MGGLPRWLKRSTVVQLILAALFFISGLVINLIQAALYFCVRPVNKHVFRKLNYYPNYWLYSQLVFAAEWWGDLDITLYCQDDVVQHLGKEHALCIMNHSNEIDWLLGFVFCDRVHMLGNSKIYGKKSLQYVPVIGWAEKFGESVFLARNWEQDKQVLGRQVANLAEYTDTVLLLLLAEGTRFTLSKREKSQQFARDKGLPVLNHHLTPRTKGFSASIPFLRDNMPAVYDIQLAFNNGRHDVEPTLSNILNGERIQAHLYIRRVPMSELPTGDEQLSNWLHQAYRVKDDLAASFNSSGDFFTDSGVPRVPSRRLPRRYVNLVNTVVWHVLTLLPILYWLLVPVGSQSSLFIVVGVLLAVSLVRNKLIDVTKISRGSEYGAVTSRKEQ